MDDILKDLGLEDLLELFTLNAITPATVLNLTEEEFRSLGMTAIGDKVRLRERCRDAMSCDLPEESPVLKKLRSLQSLRKGKSNRPREFNNRKPKDTRRISIGWKHFQNGRFRLITANKGGGKHDVDIKKSATLQETTIIIANTYFPNGKNITTSLSLDKCLYYLATFTGTEVDERLQSGDTFTLGAFVDEVRSSPIRLYLHTKIKMEDTASGDMSDSLPDLSDEEVFTGTPTITFRMPRRNRLRLRQATREASPNSPSTTISASTSTATEEVEQTSVASIDANRLRLRQATREASPNSPSTTISASTSTATEEVEQTSVASIDANRLRLRQATREASPNSPSTTISASTSTATEEVEQTSVASIDAVEIPVEVIADDSDDTEDDDLQSAIQESLELSNQDLSSKESILSWWTKKTQLTVEPVELLIHRGRILESTIRLVSRPTFDYCSPFKVNFSGETGDDLGGPKREYLSLLMIEVQKDILEGEATNKVFKHEIEKIENGRYQLMGRLLAFSILHGGPGLPVLNAALYNLMVGNDIDLPVDIEQCVYDSDTRSRLLEIKQAATQEEYSEVLRKESEWLLDNGVTSIICNKKIEEKESLIKLLVKNEIYYRVHIEIRQFINGMNSVGNFFECVLKAPAVLRELFVNNNIPLTFGRLRKLYTINFSPEGSNYRRNEQDVVYCLEAFLADCEGGATGIALKEVLSFWTGASSIPPLGFEKKLEVSFVQSEEPRLPTAHTCGMVLELWRGYTDPDVFCNDMEKAISWSGGFHLA